MFADCDGADFIAYQARANASRTACVELTTNRSMTFSEFDRRIDRCAGWLAATLAPGARVALLARNAIDDLVLCFGCMRAGMIFQPLNWRLSGPELHGLVVDAAPEMLVYQPEFERQAREAADVPSLRRLLSADECVVAVDAATPLARRRIDPDASITLLYTSGTTGRSKGVIITARNAWTTALNFALLNDVRAGDALLCDMPMFHVAGLSGVSCAGLFMGATVLISDRFTPETTVQRLCDPALGVTHFFAVPQMAMMLLDQPGFAQADLSRLKALVIGGAPLPKVTVERLLAAGVLPVEGYGISEAGTVFGLPLDRDTIARKAGSCGVRAMLIESRLVGPDGGDVSDGEVGEIWLKGPSVTPGYWNQPEATAKAFADGWFRTGDAGVRDADGFHRIVDRWKDMFISGGENVYPAEIESVLVTHPGIAEAAIIGVPDARWGESGCAYVVLRSGWTLITAQVLQHCSDRLARYKVPKHVRMVEALPRTASGKVQKDSLRRAFSE